MHWKWLSPVVGATIAFVGYELLKDRVGIVYAGLLVISALFPLRWVFFYLLHRHSLSEFVRQARGADRETLDAALAELDPEDREAVQRRLNRERI
jgi:hypothetical protein